MKPLKSNTLTGDLKIISFNEFINKFIPTMIAEEDFYLYNVRQSLQVSPVDLFGTDEPKDFSYKRKVSFLHKPTRNLHLMDILNQAQFVHLTATTNMAKIEDLVVKALEDFIVPECLVSLGDRQYLVVNPWDVKLIRNKNTGLESIVLLAPAFYGNFPVNPASYFKRWDTDDAATLIKDRKSPNAKAYIKFITKIFKRLGAQDGE